LHIGTPDVIQKNCEVYIGHQSHVPVVKVKPKSHRSVCPFLRKDKCGVHAAKPVTCAVFPLARINDADGNTFYAFQKTNCGGKGRIISVREWLESFGVPAHDEVSKFWSSMLFYLVETVEKYKNAPEDKMNDVWELMFFASYLNYKTEFDFLPQMKQNLTHLKEMLK
jgi:hypothetical protein